MTAPQRSPEWQYWNEELPGVGCKVVIICDDGCSSSIALMTDNGPLEAEDAMLLSSSFLRGAMWNYIPQSYPIAFVERHDDY